MREDGLVVRSRTAQAVSEVSDDPTGTISAALRSSSCVPRA